MDKNERAALLPQADTVLEIRAAKQRFQVRREQTLAKIAALEAERSRLLTEAEDSVIDAHDAHIQGLKRDLDQLDELEKPLPQRFREAYARETAAELLRKKTPVEEKFREFEKLYRSEYISLARRIVSIFDLERQGFDLLDDYRQAVARVPPEMVPCDGLLVKTPAQTLSGVLASGDVAMIRVGDSLRLPGATAAPQLFEDNMVIGGVQDAFWWPPRRRKPFIF